jgi:hypothetical protein
MIRNEDIFILRWGEPAFIRDHIRENGKSYAGGYFVGSECYIPARDYFHKPDPDIDWKYAFQRQWLFYMLWGRLLYDPTTPDSVFEQAFENRYGRGTGRPLLEAFARGSRMPLRLASYFKSTWDFTLYSEGFLAPRQYGGVNDKKSPFISVTELVGHDPLDPRYVSIREYARAKGKPFGRDRITPVQLADSLEKDGETVLKLLGGLKGGGAIKFEIASARAWAHLSLYFAEKIRGGMAIAGSDREKAVSALERAARHWDALIKVAEPVYKEVPLIHLGSGDRGMFSWARFRDQVLRDVEIARRVK